MSPGVLALLVLAAATAPGAAAQAGDVRLEVMADRNAITLGDPITITLRLIYPKGTRIVSFAPEAAIGDLTLLGETTGTSETVDLGRIRDTRILRLTAYELGRKEIPAFEAKYVDPAGKEDTATSAPISFEVASILAPGQTDPADIKKPAHMPAPRLWPWVLLALAAVGAAAWWLQRRWRMRPEEAVAVAAFPPRPAHELAYAELERLLSSGLLDGGRVKEFHIELAEILRRYLAARYGIDTFERTTFEVMEALRAARLPIRVHGALGEFFAACDLVKFAKHLPDSGETRGTVERAYRLVDETCEAPETAAAAAGAAP
jgi:hypothetical protein